MKTRTLTTDVEIPYLGFGTYLITADEAAAAVAAIEKMDRGDGAAWAMGDPTKAP